MPKLVLLRALAPAAALLLLSGCPQTLNVTSLPPGAAVAIDAKPMGVTPAAITLEGSKPSYEVSVSKAGYETETVTYMPANGQPKLNFELAPLLHARTFQVRSEPAGATVSLGGRKLGVTPLAIDLTFRRESKAKPWEPQTLTLALTDYQSEPVVLTDASPADPAPLTLTLLRAERTFAVTAFSLANGEPLKAQLAVDGKPLSTPAPAPVSVVFQRKDKTQPWPVFALSAEIPTVYQAKVARLAYETPADVRLDLTPVTEIMVPHAVPAVQIDANTGAVLRIGESQMLAVLDTTERGAGITGLTRITDFRRRDNAPRTPLQVLNSYAILPKGDAAVLAVTTRDGTSTYSSNLRLVRTDGSFTPAALTESARYLDTAPVVSRYEQGNLTLVFQSNRSDRAKPDLFRLTIDEKNYGPVGGIARITNDQRFNYAPTLADTAIGLVYLSLEPGYALAKPQLSTVKADGVLPTQFPITALEVAQRELSLIYFVREDPSTRKRQIFSVQPDGKLESTLINDPTLAAGDCFQPSPAFVKGGRVLFVSNSGVDEAGRANNDIYVMNADGTNIQRLTTNGSDDILPAWSPADNEPGVFYFISNRGGAYNLWRAQVADAK
jgi:hypothetical protein